MCGIIGVTGTDQAPDALGIILEGLARLEYRGYDSAGLVMQGDGGLWRRRRAHGTTSVAELVAALRPDQRSESPAPTSLAGVGHVRWATHGRPDEHNAHPHFDCTAALAVVHNGIIENYLELGEELAQDGHEMVSDTDTEVLAHMVEAELAHGPGVALAEAVRRVLKRVRGAFALAVVSAAEPDLIVAARRVSPLIVGCNDHSGLVGSDIPALLGQTRELYSLEDDQVAEVRPGSFTVTDLEGKPAEARALKVEWDLEAAEKGGFDDFMSKEIYEQPKAIGDTLMGRLLADGTLKLDEMRLSDEDLREVDKVFVVACGSSYHAGMVAKYAIEHWTRLPVEIEIASEFRYRDPVLDSQTLVIGISQSGETVDTLQALRQARAQRAKVLAISNVVDSSMARDSDAVLYTRAGPEIGVAATKTFLAQIIALEILALYLSEVRGTLYPAEAINFLDQMGQLPAQVDEILATADTVRQTAERVARASGYFFIGRHVGYPVAMEGALKLKEISYLRAEGYPAGELKHGPIALIDDESVVIGIATRNRLWEKMMANIGEVRARGARIVVVAKQGDFETAGLADEVLWVPETHPLFSPVLDVVPLQLLAYFLAKLQGNDVDRPRNLAKTVTVE